MNDIILELLTADNLEKVRAIQREDVSEQFVDSVDHIMALTQYGLAHHCMGHTWAIRYQGRYIGVILLGEAIPWETDPPEMRNTPFYRLMGFVIDNRYRSRGIGGSVLEQAIAACYGEFGVRPIALGCHRENHRAAAFYEKHGFQPTKYMEGQDRYYLRYPPTIMGASF